MPLGKLLKKSVGQPLKATPKKPMTDEQLAVWEGSRDLEAELLEFARQMQRGEGAVVRFPVAAG
jgi:hypothetical protein